MGAYRENRRVDAVRRLARVTKNEASELSDVERERQLETSWEAIAKERARGVQRPARSFAQLVPRGRR